MKPIDSGDPMPPADDDPAREQPSNAEPEVRAGRWLGAWGWVAIAGGLLALVLPIAQALDTRGTGAGVELVGWLLLGAAGIVIGIPFLRAAAALRDGHGDEHALALVAKGLRVQVIATLAAILLVGAIWLVAAPIRRSAERDTHRQTQQMDLARLVTAQDLHLRATGHYARDLAALGYAADPAVEIRIVHATPGGWAGVSSHERLPRDEGCVVFDGVAPSPPTTPGGRTPEQPGLPVCDE